MWAGDLTSEGVCSKDQVNSPVIKFQLTPGWFSFSSSSSAAPGNLLLSQGLTCSQMTSASMLTFVQEWTRDRNTVLCQEDLGVCSPQLFSNLTAATPGSFPLGRHPVPEPQFPQLHPSGAIMLILPGCWGEQTAVSEFTGVLSIVKCPADINYYGCFRAVVYFNSEPWHLFSTLLSLVLFVIIFLMYVYVCVPAWVHVYHIHKGTTEASRGQQRGNWSYRYLWAAWCGYWASNLGHLRDQSSYFTAKPFLQPRFWSFFKASFAFFPRIRFCLWTPKFKKLTHSPSKGAFTHLDPSLPLLWVDTKKKNGNTEGPR